MAPQIDAAPDKRRLKIAESTEGPECAFIPLDGVDKLSTRYQHLLLLKKRLAIKRVTVVKSKNGRLGTVSMFRVPPNSQHPAGPHPYRSALNITNIHRMECEGHATVSLDLRHPSRVGQ